MNPARRLVAANAARSLVVAAGLFAAAGATELSAHDFWIQPSSFHPAVGSVVQLRLYVGPQFEGEPLPRVPQLLSRFVLVSEAGERDVPGRAGMDPAGAVRIEAPGMQIAGYRSFDSPITIEPSKFEEYLKEEGLEKVAETRVRRGETQKPARELFSRCAKSLLEAGDAASPGAGKDRAIGLTLELVAEKNPYALAAGDELPVVLLLEGKPLTGVLVQGLLHKDPAARVAARTDKSGRARLRLAKTGFWLVKAVEMQAVPAGGEADWKSLWASLTFENGRPNPVGKAP
jgi:uncharacterized GH25 family protein